MYDETWDLYKKEKDLLHKNNSRFLLTVLLFSLMIVALIVNAAGKLIEMHTLFMGDAASSYLVVSALFSIVLPLASLIFLLSLLKKWESINKSSSDLIKVRSQRIENLEKVLSQAGLIPLELCVAYNERKNRNTVQTEVLEETNDLKEDPKKNQNKKKKTNVADKDIDDLTAFQTILNFFRRFTLFLFIILILMIVFMGYSLSSAMLFYA